MNNPKHKKLVRVLCFILAALMVVSIAYLTIYMIIALL